MKTLLNANCVLFVLPELFCLCSLYFAELFLWLRIGARKTELWRNENARKRSASAESESVETGALEERECACEDGAQRMDERCMCEDGAQVERWMRENGALRRDLKWYVRDA